MDRSIFTTSLIDIIFPEGSIVDENLELTPSTKIESAIKYNPNDSNSEKK